MKKERNDTVTTRYLLHEYASKNPTWDIEDSSWKAQQVLRMLQLHHLVPNTIVDVGCGAGGVVAELGASLPGTKLHGFDIAPDAAAFWPQYSHSNIRFTLGDFFDLGIQHYDLMLVLDVIEHLPNPFEFLVRARGRATYHLFHFPLDLSAVSVLRETPLINVRDKVGHIHFYTKNLAHALVCDCGYEIVDWFYTGAYLAAPRRSWKTRMATLPRRIAYAIDKDAGVRLFGGETMMLLARAREGSGQPDSEGGAAL